MATVTFVNSLPANGAYRREINCERNGQPFGQLFTYMEKGTVHPWHAKALTGEYRAFYAKNGGLLAAMDYLTKLAGG